MRQMAILVALLFLLACPLTLASDAARMTLPSGMNSPLTIRCPELAQAPAPDLIGEGLRATYEMVAGSPEVIQGREDVAYTKATMEQDWCRSMWWPWRIAILFSS